MKSGILKAAMVGRIEQGKVFILQNGIFLLLALFFAVGLKYHYSKAGSEDLAWILRPTAALVEQISGIPFEEEAHTGFVNYTHRVIIAPACAGVNFLIIAFCMAVSSGLHHSRQKRGKILWLAAGMVSAYLLTIFVNVLRIILSIYSYDADIYSGWLTPQRMHRLEGVIIYFFFLCLFYRIMKKAVDHLTQRAGGKQRESIEEGSVRAGYSRWALAGLVPLFWYGLMTLAIPLLNGAIDKDGGRFVEHGGMIITGCLIVLAVVFLLQRGWERIKRLKMNWT
jgi:exosortase K